MDSLIPTSLSDAILYISAARYSVVRCGFALLVFLTFSFSSFSQVLINEVITDPQQDWSTNGFDGTDGGGTIDSNDDWVELYITANGLDLTGWTIELNDGTDVSGTIAAGGAFVTMNYISGTGGTFTNTDAGDYIVLGQMSSGAINQSVTVVLRDNTSALIDQVIIAAGSGTMFTGNASSVTDESVCRIPNGQDTDIEVDDFVKTRATLGANNSPTGTVLINEVVTNPRTDWSTNGFDGTDGGGAISEVDEWIELYIGTANLNLTKWTFTINDAGGTFSGDLTSTGAFDVVNYIGSGDFTQTAVGDYLVLGDPDGANNMDTDVFIRLFDADGTLVDDVEIGDNQEGDAIDDGAPNSFGSTVADESIARISNASDTDVDATDFQRVVSTLGTENGLMNVFVDAAAANDNGLGTVGNPKQLIQSGIDLVLSTGTVTVASGTYSENLTIAKSLTLNGANQGVAGSGVRGAESIVEPSAATIGITVGANNVTIDGFQLGTNNTTSNHSVAISSTGFTGLNVSNNLIYANSVGISIAGLSSGTGVVSSNAIEMLNLVDPLNPGDPSFGILAQSISGTADVDFTSNDIQTASYGFFGYALTASPNVTIDGGNYTGCTKGIEINNTNGMGAFSPSNATINNVTMSGFVDPGGGLTQPDTQAGIYVFVTGAATVSDDIAVSIDNADISGIGNGATDYSGIYIADFQATGPFLGTDDDGIGITATITNSNIYNNQNRGIYTRGRNAVSNITACTFTNNGFSPNAGSGAAINVFAQGTVNVQNSVFTNPSSGTATILISQQQGTITASNNSLDNNGNVTGLLADIQTGTTGSIDMSGNWLGTTTEATIVSLLDFTPADIDFTPYLGSGTDSDLVTGGFQGDFSSLNVSASGAQTGGTGRIAEAVGLVNASGTIQVNAGTYAENLTIAKSLTLNGANQGVAGSGSRSAESIIEPSADNIGITVGANDITVDGFQFGTNNTTSNITTAISNTGFSGFTGNNNRIFANASGVLIIGISSGTVGLSNNYVEMLGLANPLLATSPSIGLGMINISGTADVDFTNNDINTATYGIGTFGLTSSTVSEITGGSYSGCTIGISSSNFDGTASYSASSLTISNVTMSGFAGPDGGITGASGIPQAGIYAFTTASAPSTDHDLTINVDNADISGVGNGATDYAGIHAADFFNTDPDLEATDDKGITMTVSNSNIYDNTNRGVHSRGADAVVTINSSTISNNTNAGGVVFARGTLNINNSFIILPSTGATAGLLAQTHGQIVASNSHFDLNGNGDASTLIADIQDPAGDETINVSGSWLTSTNEAIILSLIDESDTDFTPFLESGTDSDLVTAGFQGDFDAVTVTSSGIQSSGDRIQEGHDLVNTDGTVTVLLADYAEALTVSKNIAMNIASGTTIDDVTLNGGNLSILNNTITIDNSLTMTNGVFDIDQDDGDKSNDPVFVLPAIVNGSSYGATTHFEGRIEASVTGASSFAFEVGDEGAYRPATLTPTTTTTFQVAHIAEATPVGGGATNPDIVNLIGDASGNPSGTIQSVLNFRYWDIDVAAAGPPGVTNVALQISGGDNATDPVSLGMTRFDGSDWEILTLVSSTGSDPYIITGQTSSFSEFSVYSTNATANPLPVELIDFIGVRSGQDIKLTWSTLTEINADHFQVEHSVDGLEFNAIGKVNSYGNSNELRNYDFLDKNVRTGVHYYRLKMVDFDETYEYSSIVQVTPDLSTQRILVYPNPTADLIQVEGVETSYIKRLNFYDLTGKLFKTSSSMETSTISVSDLPKGQYLMRLEMVDGSVFEGKIVKK